MFEHGTKAAGARTALDSAACDFFEGIGGKFKFNVFEAEESLVLTDEGVARFSEHTDKIMLREFAENGDDGETADEFGDHAVLDEVFGLDLAEDVIFGVEAGVFACNIKADTTFTEAAFDDGIESNKGATADEEDVGCVDTNVLLMRMFATTFWWDVAHCALKNFKEGLLDAFTGDVAGDGDIARGLVNFVNFVYVDDTPFRARDIIVCVLEKLEDDVFDVFTDVTGFGEGGGVSNGKGDIKKAGERARDESFARTGGADHEDVAFFDLDIIGGLKIEEEALIVIEDGDGDGAFGGLLADDVGIEVFFNFAGGTERNWQIGLATVFEDLGAAFDTVFADEDRIVERTLDELGGAGCGAAEGAEGGGFFGLAGASSIVHVGSFNARSRRLLLRIEDFVHNAVSAGFFGGHEEIAIGIAFDGFEGLTSAGSENAIKTITHLEDFLCLNADVGGGTLDATPGLVNHHAGIRESVALALGAGGQEDRAHATCLTDAVGGNGAFEEFDRIVDRQASRDRAARGVDVEIDVFARVVGLQEEKLSDDEVGDFIGDRGTEEDNTVFEQAGENVIGPLGVTGRFKDDRNELIVHVFRGEVKRKAIICEVSIAKGGEKFNLLGAQGTQHHNSCHENQGGSSICVGPMRNSEAKVHKIVRKATLRRCQYVGRWGSRTEMRGWHRTTSATRE